MSAIFWFGLLAAGAGFALLRSHRAARRRAPCLPDLTPRAKRLADEGIRAVRALREEIATAPAFVRDLFQMAEASVRHVHDTYGTLVLRLHEIDRFLASGEPTRVAQDCEALQRKIRLADDPRAKAALEAGFRSLGEYLRIHSAVVLDGERLEAELTRIRADLVAARAKLVRAKTA